MRQVVYCQNLKQYDRYDSSDAFTTSQHYRSETLTGNRYLFAILDLFGSNVSLPDLLMCQSSLTITGKSMGADINNNFPWIEAE